MKKQTQIGRMQAKLLEWYDTQGRSLPWRIRPEDRAAGQVAALTRPRTSLTAMLSESSAAFLKLKRYSRRDGPNIAALQGRSRREIGRGIMGKL